MIYIKRNYHNLTYKNCTNSQRYRGNALECKNCSSSPYLLPQRYGISVLPPMITSNSIDINTSINNDNRIPETDNQIQNVSQVMPILEPTALTKNDNQDEAESETIPPLEDVSDKNIAIADEMNRPEIIATASNPEINSNNQDEVKSKVTPPLASVVQNEKDDIAIADEINRPEIIETASISEINNDNQDEVKSKVTPPLASEVQIKKDDIAIADEMNKPDNIEIAFIPVKSDNKNVPASKVMPMFEPAVLTEKEDIAIADEINRPEVNQTILTPKTTNDDKDRAKSESVPQRVFKTVNEKQQNKILRKDDEKIRSEDGLYGRGLFYYKNWWYRDKVEIIVNGKFISGIPIFKDHNTLRIVNDKHSYFVPVEKIDYIRTTDGFHL